LFFSLFCLLVPVCYHAYAQKDSLTTIIKPYNALFLPVITRSIETSWAFGVATSLTFHLKSKDSATTRTSNLQAISLYTLHKQFIVAINGSIYFPGEKFIINQQLSYSYFPDLFWGLGKTSPDSSQENYKFNQYYIYLHPQRLLSKNIFLGVIYEYQRVFNMSYPRGGLFDRENVVGRFGYHISGLGLSFTYDTRNNAFSPDRGTMLQFHFNHFAPFFGSDFKYTNFVIDARKFLRVYREQVLAFQAFGFFNAGDVPLRSLASLGGSNSMRGYYEGRYRDKNEVVLQSEYRIPIIGRFGAVVFGDFGNIGSRLSDLNFQDLKYSYGGGARVALSKSEKLNLRLDYGIGRGFTSKGFYFQLGEAF
jgi:outer membrane protein assembly factor BamA